MDRNSAYVRTIVYLHGLRDKTKETITKFQEQDLSHTLKNTWDNTRRTVMAGTKDMFMSQDEVKTHIPEKYNHIFRRKTRLELVRLSGTVCGIEFCYAAETAFVTPTLLGLGLNIKFVSMIWCLSPLVGFFVTPLLGSLSDSCESRLGRRRPFILLLSAGILLGLILVPNGRAIGMALGDSNHQATNGMLDKKASGTITYEDVGTSKTFGSEISEDFTYRNTPTFKEDLTVIRKSSIQVENASSFSPNITDIEGVDLLHTSTISSIKGSIATHEQAGDGTTTIDPGVKSTISSEDMENGSIHVQTWSVVFTVLGTVLLDFCSDACQSPSRTYLLDSSLPEDNAVGLSTFTLMAGFGGSVGYLMGAVHWDDNFVGSALGGQINAVFTIVAVIFVLCLISTISSFPEIPLPLLKNPQLFCEFQEKIKSSGKREKDVSHEMVTIKKNNTQHYGSSLENGQVQISCSENGETNEVVKNGVISESIISIDQLKEAIPQDMKPSSVTPEKPCEIIEQPSMREYLRSIIRMPGSLAILCLTNLFCWMSLVCYSLYFTDFVGECVFEGNPQAPVDSVQYQLYQDGVSFGCWGMALYSISCSVYSYFIEMLVKKLGAKPVYIGGQLVHSIGMATMAAFRHPVAVILLSPTAGVMYSTLFTMPYLLIAQYHSTQKFKAEASGDHTGVRGIGTDVAVVSSMVFLSQFILSLTMGTIVEAVGSKVATVAVSAFLSACGGLCATRVLYLDA